MGEPTSPGEVALPAGELLANLTEHDVVLVVRPRREGDSAEESSLTRILPDGRFARVDDEAARIRERLIDTASGVVRLTWLRRSDRLVDLPAPKVGTRFVVSRVTALAARDRGDLVFPFDEIRDEHGRVRGRRGRCGWRPVFAVAGLAALVVAAWRWHRRGVMLEERGTAYVIEEQAITWRHEEKESVLADVGGGFAAVLRVPGPAELGSNWRWEADGQAAPQWDAHVDELVSSFWSVHYNDSQVTDNAVFVWAPWLVAMAFGARATARRRGLVLHVRQRPSYGAAGPHRRPRPNDVAHDFIRREGLPILADVAALHEPVVTSAMVTMTIKPLSAPLPGQHGCPGGHDDGHGGPDTGAGDEGPLLLIVRVTHGPVGPIPLDLAKTGPFTIYVSPSLAGRVIPAGTWIVRAHEWRLASRTAGLERVPELPWPAFPAAAEAIADWVVAQAAAHPGRIVLLATRIPQELAVGLGVQVGQRSWDRTPGRQWPQQVYPVFHAGDRLVVPDLQLGAESVPSQRV